MTLGAQQIDATQDGAQPRRRGGARAPRAERRCIASGKVADPAGLIRFVADPQGLLTVDLAAKLPGRGAWVTARRDCLERAVKRKLFGRALGREVSLPEDLVAGVEQALQRRLIELIGLSAKAGQAICGFEKVHAALGAGRVAVLIQAADAAADGRGKLARLAHAVEPSMPILAPLEAEPLGRALGRDAVVHVALLPGRLAEQVVQEAERLAGLTADGDESNARPGTPGQVGNVERNVDRQ